ncbi:MAG: hypothetical protein AB2770_06570 [Candidatus Thiodiazotropha taylori]
MTIKRAKTPAGHLSENKRLKYQILHEQKNGCMLDILRLLSVWSPVITKDNTEPAPVISHYIKQTMDLTYDFDKLKEIAFIHTPLGIESGKDWLLYFKDQSSCDRGRDLTPPRYGKGREFSTLLEIFNYQSTLKSLAKVSSKKTYTISFNLTKEMILKAEKTRDVTKTITEKLNYRFKSAFNNKVPDYYLLTEFSEIVKTKAEFIKGEKRRHYHGAILLDPKDLELAKKCFKQVNPESRSIKLVEQPDVLNFYPIRWGGYVAKFGDQSNILTTHPLYATKQLKSEAKHHYQTISTLIRAYQTGCLPEPSIPSDRLKSLIK